jgi:2-methylcitrate dehydratase PrpD
MERIDSPVIRSLAERIDYFADDEFTSRYPQNWGCSMTVRFTDGSEIVRKVSDASGSLANPISMTQLDAKFIGLTSPFLGETRAKKTLEALKKLEDLSSVTGLLKAEGCAPKRGASQ